MLKNFRAAWRLWRRENARRFLYEVAPEHLGRRTQMCCYSFDAIGIAINVDGRCDDAALASLLSIVDVSGRNVIDVGANIGNHTVAFAQYAARVFAFEPHPTTYQLLRLNVSALANVDAINVGASDRAGSAQAVSPHSNFGASAISDRAPIAGESSWTFRLTPLDSIPDLENIALLKLDVEGHESQALEGARGLLEREKPVVVLEQNAESIVNGTSNSVELLKSIGYSYLYCIDTVLPWRTPQSLPGPVRKAVRMLEILFFGPVDWTARIQRIVTLEKRDYPMLLASTLPLEIGGSS